MAESETDPVKSRRWSGFVCPDCRFVFRVPRDHDGEGIVCPSCRRILRLPKDGDATAPLMAPLQKVGFSQDGPETRGEKRRRARRKRTKKRAEVPDWDPASGKWKTPSAGRRHILHTVSIWLVSLAALVAAVYLFKQAGKTEEPKPAEARQEIRLRADNPVSIPLLPPDANGSDAAEPPADAE